MMENDEKEMEVGSEEDSSDDGDNNELEKKAEELEHMLGENKYLYDTHVELVGLYKTLADLTSMRLAYQRFHETYPLTPELWLTWLKDEISLCNTEEEHKNVSNLFMKATEDYLSVKLWLQYAEYSLSTPNLDETRSVLERAVNTAGLHVEQGSLLWDTLREFEMCQLPDPSEKEYQQQLQRIVNVFKRQLSVPLLFMDKTHGEWEQFKEVHPDLDADNKSIEWKYNKASKLLDEYKPYEDRLMASSTNEQLWGVFKEYIGSVKDPSTVICLYERAVEKLCLVPDVWLEYLSFVCKLGDVALKVSARALRNISWSEDLWVARLRILEKLEQPDVEIVKCFEDGMVSIQGGLEMWLAYLDYNKRKQSDKLMKLFEHAEEQLIQEYDTYHKLTRYHARMLAKSGDIEKVRNLWKKIMHDQKMKSSTQYWLEYINLERQFGTNSQARALFNRALSCCKDWPQFIGDEWILFEREEGTLDDLIKATEKVKKAVKEVPMVNEKTEERSNNRKRKSDDVKDSVTKPIKKMKQEVITKAKNQGPPVDLDTDKSVFISNMSPFINEEHLKKFFPNGKITLATNNKGESRCFGYVQFQTEAEAEDAIKRDRELLEKRPVFISKCKRDKNERNAAFKYSTTIEDNKLFVRGLPVKYTVEEVEAIFKPYNCTNVRLVLHKSGQPKGLAYVDFGNGEDAAKAVKGTDQSTVGGFVISVAISAPPAKHRVAGEQKPEPGRNARTRLQVPMVPRSVQKPKIEVAGNGQAVPKSNNDFRNMLLNKK